MLLKASLALMGTTTSFTRGMPRRDTWTQRPRCIGFAPLFWAKTRTLRRDEVLHTPMTGSPSVTSVLGTCRAMDWTL